MERSSRLTDSSGLRGHECGRDRRIWGAEQCHHDAHNTSWRHWRLTVGHPPVGSARTRGAQANYADTRHIRHIRRAQLVQLSCRLEGTDLAVRLYRRRKSQELILDTLRLFPRSW